MRKYEKAQIEMARATVNFLQENPTGTATLPGVYKVYLDEIIDILGTIKDDEAAHELTIKGVTEAKDQIREKLIAETIDIIRKMIVYAKFVNNVVLLREISFSETKLRKFTEEKLTSVAQAIHNRATDFKEPLAPYGITVAVISEQQDIINSFIAAREKCRNAIAKKDEITEILKEKCRKIMLMLKNLDETVNTIKATEPIFFNEYKKNRRTNFPHARTESLIATYKDSISKIPLENVVSSLMEVTDPLLSATKTNKTGKTKKTGKSGRVIYKNKKTADYIISGKKRGYKDASMKISLNQGERLEIDINMEPT